MCVEVGFIMRCSEQKTRQCAIYIYISSDRESGLITKGWGWGEEGGVEGVCLCWGLVGF